MEQGAERKRVETFGRLENGLREGGDWYLWGPYVSERQWGTVREDYSANGTAWEYLPHDHARSRAYRWGEDGLAGFCDVEQRLCLGLALWNGRDPILKERIFGLTGNQGNHGEDAKEYWWYLDATPSHCWNRWRYHYPQSAVPVRATGRRERRAVEARPRVRADGHGHLRRRPLLDRRGPLCEGRPVRRPAHRPGDQRRSGGGHDPRAPDGVVPEHVGVGGRCHGPRAAGIRRRPDRHRASVPRAARDRGGRRAGRLAARASLLRQRDERRAPVRHGGPLGAPQGRHQRPRRLGSGEREPAAGGDEGGVPLPGRPSRRARPWSFACACAAPEPTRRLGPTSRR